MDLSIETPDNIEFMLDEIKNKLRVVNVAALNSKTFFPKNYEDLYDLYTLVNRKSSFSVSELDAIVSELGKIRK